MTEQEKIEFIESYDFKVQKGLTLIRIYDPLDKNGFKLIGNKDDIHNLLNETINYIKSAHHEN